MTRSSRRIGAHDNGSAARKTSTHSLFAPTLRRRPTDFAARYVVPLMVAAGLTLSSAPAGADDSDALRPPIDTETMAQAGGKGGGKSKSVAPPRSKPGAKSGRVGDGDGGGKSSSAGGAITDVERDLLDRLYAASDTLSAVRDGRPDIAGDLDETLVTWFESIAENNPNDSRSFLARAAGPTFGAIVAGQLESFYMLRGSDRQIVAYHELLVRIHRSVLEEDPNDCFEALIENGSIVFADGAGGFDQEVDGAFAALVRSATGRDAATSVSSAIDDQVVEIGAAALVEIGVDGAVLESQIDAYSESGNAPALFKENLCRFQLAMNERFQDQPERTAARMIQRNYIGTSNSAGGTADVASAAPKDSGAKARPPSAGKGGEPDRTAGDRFILDNMYEGSQILRALRVEGTFEVADIDEFLLGAHNDLVRSLEERGDELDGVSSEALAQSSGFIAGLFLASRVEEEYMLRGSDAAVIAYRTSVLDVHRAVADSDPGACFERLISSLNFGSVPTPERQEDAIETTFVRLVESSVGRDRVSSVPRQAEIRAEAIAGTVLQSADIDAARVIEFLQDKVAVEQLSASDREDICLFALRMGEFVLNESPSVAADIIRWSYLSQSRYRNIGMAAEAIAFGYVSAIDDVGRDTINIAPAPDPIPSEDLFRYN